MAGLGLLFAGLSGGGAAVESSLASQQKSDQDMQRESALLNQRSQLEIEREKRIQEIKDAPIKRLQDSAQAFAGQEVPVEAAPVTATSAASAQRAGLQQEGLQGNVDDLRANISQIADPTERAGALAQLDSQVKAQGLLNSDAVAGQTRKRTSTEALEAAVDAAKSGDLQAYAVGKGLVADKTMTVGEGATIIDPRTGKVIFSNTAKQARTDAMEAGRDRRHDDEMKMQEKKLDAMSAANKAGSADDQRVLRNQVVPVLTGDINRAQDKIDALIKAKKDMYGPDLVTANEEIAKQEKIIAMTAKSRIKFFTDAGVAVPDIYQTGASTDTSASAPGTPTQASKPIASLPPGAKKIGTSGGKDVYEDGNGKRFIQN